MDKKILFVTYGGGHVNMVIPVVKLLMKNKGYAISVLGLTTARAELEREGIPCFSFRDLQIDGQANQYGKALIKSLSRHPSIPREESLAYMGLSYQCLVQEYGEKYAAELYEKQGRQIFLPVSLMENIIQDGDYNLVVTTNSPRAERAAIIAADNLGISSVCMVDLFALQEIKWIGQKGYASKVCVLSDYVKELMLKVGRAENEIIVTGNPAFDSMVDQKTPNIREAFRRRKGWSDDEKIVLWASNIEPRIHPFSDVEGDSELPAKVEVRLHKLVNNNSNIRVVIRSHPNDSRIPDAHDKVELTLAYDDLGELLMAVDCVVVLSSTVGIQAALMDKPLVNIKLSIFSRDAPYDEMGISIGVNELEHVNSAILKALTEGQSGKGLPSIGMSANKVVKVIEELLRKDLCLE